MQDAVLLNKEITIIDSKVKKESENVNCVENPIKKKCTTCAEIYNEMKHSC